LVSVLASAFGSLCVAEAASALAASVAGEAMVCWFAGGVRSFTVGGGGSVVSGTGTPASIFCCSLCCAMPGWLASMRPRPSAVEARRRLNRTRFTS
jgi:hypothetical protein